MPADTPKAPERIWADGPFARLASEGGLVGGSLVCYDKQHEGTDIAYTRSDLYPATPEVIGELVAELQSIRDFAASLQYETGAIARGGLQMVVRRMDDALTALTAKESR